MNVQRLILGLAVLLLAGCGGGKSAGEIRATGAVTPKALERVQVTPKAGETTQVVTTKAPTATEAPRPTDTPRPAPPTATMAPVVADPCIRASDGQIEAIQAGVNGVAAENEVREAWAVKSKDFENVWMVAAYVYGPGMEQGAGPGVWAINGDPASPGMTLAVDGMAKEFSDYPDASKTKAAITLAADGVEAAKRCAEEKR